MNEGERYMNVHLIALVSFKEDRVLGFKHEIHVQRQYLFQSGSLYYISLAQTTLTTQLVALFSAAL